MLKNKSQGRTNNNQTFILNPEQSFISQWHTLAESPLSLVIHTLIFFLFMKMRDAFDRVEISFRFSQK
jgi:hypothetical protein